MALALERIRAQESDRQAHQGPGDARCSTGWRPSLGGGRRWRSHPGGRLARCAQEPSGSAGSWGSLRPPATNRRGARSRHRDVSVPLLDQGGGRRRQSASRRGDCCRHRECIGVREAARALGDSKLGPLSPRRPAGEHIRQDVRHVTTTGTRIASCAPRSGSAKRRPSRRFLGRPLGAAGLALVGGFEQRRASIHGPAAGQGDRGRPAMSDRCEKSHSTLRSAFAAYSRRPVPWPKARSSSAAQRAKNSTRPIASGESRP